MTDHDNKQQGRSAAGVVVLVCVVLLPVFYVLSVGPAAWLVKHKCLPETIVDTIYLPLLWLHENVKPARYLLEWYVALWER